MMGWRSSLLREGGVWGFVLSWVLMKDVSLKVTDVHRCNESHVFFDYKAHDDME